ncbi:T9SS type B sorting domain-containing protein [Flagellimonas abyssi]|uniref:T9SS type B sorting domain-containing protein n=1 Tax=Flagellimonas abyssi TaxID=2864871 RepID=A0ABS7EWG1_9FLAO|nr:T9SS type B sorting domain-containing protein [Allomuricauda abyssi]MBW8201957.1 T9SS type B sorting domain-containing protein [Allomuricauda abyssi]
MNHRLQFFLIVLFSFVSFVSQAQMEASIWYFGENAGLDFRSGTPVALEDGEMFTKEGCATISDPLGNLLFYTDGSNIWNRNHQIMPNGSGLLGDTSTTQSAIIVPKPEDSNIYYVFTADEERGPHGINFSEVDIGLDGGLGDVTVKNVPLYTPSMEKLTAVKHANGRDVWVLTHDWYNADYKVYLVTPAGVSTTPVVSTAGLNMIYTTNGTEGIGYLKVSPDGKKVAICHIRRGLELLDFDTSTGKLSNALALNRRNNQYGVEFSPSSQVLYASNLDGPIYQYDLGASDIPSSEIQINQDNVPGYGLQLGLDGKIYVTHRFRKTISVVNDPDEVGLACNYEYGAIDLGTGRGWGGLPQFIQSYFLVSGIEADKLCLGDTTQFHINSSQPITSILWDFGDGNNSTDENPTHSYAAPGTYTLSCEVSTALGTETKTKIISISKTPVANAISDIERCQTEATFDMDLATLDAQVLGTQSPSEFAISYFATQQDADGNIYSLDPITVLNLGSTTIFTRISNNQNPNCYDITSFDIIVKQAPQLFVPTDWVVCDTDGDGLHSFDLTTKDSEILNGQDASLFNVSYYASALEADNGTNPLNTDHSVSVLDETLFYRIENKTYSDCFEVGSFTIGVIDQVVANRPSDLKVCDTDNDGTAQFDLSDAESEVLGAQSASGVILSYHESQADADGNTDPLPNLYVSNSYQKTVYVRVSNAQDSSCYATNSFQLNIYDVPEVPEVLDWLVCDNDNDGKYTFDLDEKADEIIAKPSETSLAFYASEADASLEQNPIYGNYQNASNPQTVYFRLNNVNNNTCHSIGSFDLEVFNVPTAYVPTNMVICAVDETGVNTINLSQKDAEVLNGQDALSYEVSYHSSEVDALNGERYLDKENYSNTAMSERIYARIQHRELVSCYDIIDFELTINPLPNPGLEEVYVICPDSPELVLDAGTFESYRWEDENGSLIGNGQTIDVTDLGKYTLTVIETKNGLSCSNTVGFEVLSSGAPESFEITADGLSDRVTLTVDAVGTGDFEYSIDGRSYQSSNQFEVFPGKYTVFVRDLLGCRTISKELIAIGYQKFFSPNGDGINDSWNIIGGELYPDAQLFLYDRYGKLLGQLTPQGQGWDGTILGRRMPSTDYWFKYVYDNGKTYAGHFSLRR